MAKLEGARMISRRPHPEHGRILQAHLTERGEELVSRAHGVVGAIEERMLAALDGAERSRLLEALRSCVQSLDSGEGA